MVSSRQDFLRSYNKAALCFVVIQAYGEKLSSLQSRKAVSYFYIRRNF